jgi:hypothetical protein
MDVKMKTTVLPARAPDVGTVRSYLPRMALAFQQSPFLKDPEVKARVKGSVTKFVAAEKAGCVFEVLVDAWVMAAAETAVLTGSHLTKNMLPALELPATPTTLVVKMGDVMGTLFMRHQLVLVNKLVGDRPGCMAIVDYLAMDRRGRWHIVLVRATGGGMDTHVATDYVKACAMAAVADLPLSTVTILYLADNRKVVLELPVYGDDSPAALKADEARRRRLASVLTDTREVPGWDPAADASIRWDNVAAWLRAAIAGFLHMEPEDVVLEEARILGGVGLDLCDVDADGAGGEGAGDPTPAADAMTCEEVRDEDEDEDDHEDPHQHVKGLYKGVLTRGFLVYYWNARPWGVPIRWVV